MEEKKETGSVGRYLLSEGLIIALFTLIAYWLAYVYYHSYYSYFKIPDYFISLTLSSTLPVIIIIVGLIFAMFSLIINIVNHYGISHLGSILLISISIISGVVATSVINTTNTLKFSIALVLIVVVIALVIRYIIKKGTPEFNSSVSKYVEYVKDSNSWDKTMIILGIVAIITVILWLITSNVGYDRAKNERQFLVTDTSPEMIVITKYDSNIICIPFNRTNKEANNGFMVIDMKKRPEIVYHFEMIGPILVN